MTTMEFKKIKKMHMKNIKLLNTFGFRTKVKQLLVLSLLLVTMLLNNATTSNAYSCISNKTIQTTITAQKSVKSLNLTKEEKDLLCRLVSAEAKGESYRG